MKKLSPDESRVNYIHQSLLKLSTVLLIVFTLPAVAIGYSYSQDASVKLSYNTGKVVDFVKSIEDQTEYRVFYKSDQIDMTKVVEVSSREMTVSSLLDEVLKGSRLTYKLLDKMIVITPYDAVKTVSGKVTDENDEAIPGVNIVIKGTSQGTISDVNGQFSMEVPDEDAILVFSYIGYTPEEIAVGNRSVLDISLMPDITSLKEVVVVGYGTQKKADVTGAVSTISIKDFKDQPVTTVSSAMQGRMAGVNITNNSGEPGGSVKIRIRGANSIQGGNDPLIVMDGIQLTNMSLQDINVNDIASIEVLKDASATAIYGSRGANGVVMITTKKGTGEKTTVTFTSNTGIANRTYKYDLLNPVAYAEMANAARGAAIYSTEQIEQLHNGGGTDWQDEIFRTGVTQNYQLGVSGSTPKSSYYFSGNYIDQTGIVKYSTFKKYAMRSNIESHITDKLTIGANIFLNRSQGYNNGDLGYKGSPVFAATIWGPAEPVYNADGTYNLHDPNGATTSYNPVALSKERYWLNTTNAAVLNTKIDYDITDYLKLSIVAGVDANFTESGNLNRAIINGGNSGASKNNSTGFNWQNSNILTFHKVINNVHDLSATGVFEQSKGVYQGSNSSGTGLPFENIYFYNLGLNENQSIGSYYSAWSLRSWVGRLNYMYDNKYLLTATYRADGSSKFPNNKWGYFPSVALGWRLAEEGFIQQLNIFDELKLRGSWGITGNQAVDAYATVPTMGTVTYSYGTSNESKGYVVNIPSNPLLKWEKTTQTNIGADMAFFGSRLTLSADYFRKETSDLLLPVLIPSYGGGGSYIDNVGSVENHGFEFVLGGVPLAKGDFTWNANLNFTSVRNKVIDLGENEYIEGGIYGNGLVTQPQTRIIPGQPLGTFYGLHFLGIYQANEAGTAPVNVENPDGSVTVTDLGSGAARYGLQPGDNKYEDVNDDGVIDGNDRTIIGYALPKFTMGFNNKLSYKNLECNVFVQATQGNDILNLSYAAAATQIGDSQTITSADVNPWTAENPNNMWPRLASSSSKEYLGSSKWLQSGSFVRVKNVSLSYLVPVEKARLTSLRLSVSAQNLFTFTNYKGYDPEASTSGGSDRDGGVDLGAYPSARTYTFSLQLNL